ncbi:MAG TPA: glucose-1-phosphate cytidylyltransferase [Candidatus Sulfotelmatobacter sp.]|nr:glucose-1-phosphate cytidylyltransferase [Candidatus Sulfotelmatobacter sp.]
MVKKAVILAGGRGTRLAEVTETRPKPMIEIGERPILWHIMKIYAAHGIHEFIICLGYRGYVIKEYFRNYHLHMADVTLNLADNSMEVHQIRAEPWRVTLVETGTDTNTGGRLLRVRDYVGNETFCMTYGDGVGNVDITASIRQHEAKGCLATVTAVRPPARFGALAIRGDHVEGFQEKPLGDGGRINGGFFVLSPRVFERIAGDDTVWENEPLEGLARDRQLVAYSHDGFWQPMDTLRDKILLDGLWESGEAPWKVW